MEHPAEGDEPLVVTVLVARIGAWVRRALVSLCGADLDVGEVRTAGRRAGSVDVGLGVVRIVASVVPAGIDSARDRVRQKPMVELIPAHPGRIVVDPLRRAPAGAAVARTGPEDVASIARRLIHPRAVQRPPKRAAAPICVAGGIEQGAAAGT